MAPEERDSRREVVDHLPEIEQIEDVALRAAVTRIWANAWKSAPWTDLARVPKSLDLPTRRTLVTHTRAVTQIAGQMVGVLSAAHYLEISRDKTMAIAQQMNASGAAGPSPFATVAGITKIPAPIVELTMFAVRAGIPMPRTN